MIPLRNPTVWSAAALIALAAATRLLPHPPNFTAVLAVAMFAGALYARPYHALLVPWLAMAVSDLVLGWHATLWAVYLAVALGVGCGRGMLLRLRASGLLAAGLSSTALFFITTNFAVWAHGGLYPPTAAGLLACYIAAIPFFHHTLLATLLYGAGLLAAVRWMRGRDFPDALAARHT